MYREEGLTVRKRRARRRAVGQRAPILVETRQNARWSLDFVHDQFACGRRFRILNVVDDVTRECLAAIPEPQHQTGLFKGSYDEIWTETCPACGCRAFMAGEQTGEDIGEERDEHAIWEIVDREFVGEEFRCPACELTLMGSDEIDAGGLNYIHEDQQEREMEYEPDYGND